MKTCLEVEQIRTEMGLSVIFMCNALGITVAEYELVTAGRYTFTTFQLIGLVGAIQHPLQSILCRDK